ncbi:DUF305 domain-containing protein [Saccharothrix longispora]|uniref:DUF305 domain-containing protein n=1 Tax=Saccharothrix longispora TaxID=33920 RepID=UPI0028FD880F|nr:DUF305 domain-containing protein [Saccharothrix longispora]MBY8850095.1 DUF305 domain-containing protein [Saccharothrix sp. MB29]MDU0292955.1 DUF305 domain-containing protein [Saccharothrix longispora]
MRRSLVLSSLVIALVACSPAPPATSPATTAPPTGAPTGTAPPTTAPPTGTGGLSATDTAYAQLAIPQVESALPLLDLVAARSGDPALTALVAEVGGGHRAELARLRAVLADAGVAYLDEHRGHDMPGMITAEEVEAAGRLTGADFDARAGALLRAHFEESATVARAELAAGSDAALLALAGDLDAARRGYLAKLSSS